MRNRRNPTGGGHPRLPVGVYMSHQRKTAIVFACTNQGNVKYITMENGKVEYQKREVLDFAQRFSIYLPHYAPGRAARIYMESCLEKTGRAAEVLAALATSE